MYNCLTAATIYFIRNGGKHRLPYFLDKILHDGICSEWVFKCCSPMNERWFEGLSPVAGLGGACCSTRKGKWGEIIPNFLDTMIAGGHLRGSWLDNIDSGCLLKLVTNMLDGVVRWTILTCFPRMTTAGFFRCRAAVTNSTGSSLSNSPPAYSSGSFWSSTASRDDAFLAETSTIWYNR